MATATAQRLLHAELDACHARLLAEGLNLSNFGPNDVTFAFRLAGAFLTGFAAALQPNPLDFANFVGELSFGGAVNQVNIHVYVETLPFGGVGPAGMGHYHGKYWFDMLTYAKSMFVSPPEAAIDHLFPPPRRTLC